MWQNRHSLNSAEGRKKKTYWGTRKLWIICLSYMKSKAPVARLDLVCSSITHIHHERKGCDWQLKNSFFFFTISHPLPFRRGTTVPLALNLSAWTELNSHSTTRRGHMTLVWPVRALNFPGKNHLFREEHPIQWEPQDIAGHVLGLLREQYLLCCTGA